MNDALKVSEMTLHLRQNCICKQFSLVDSKRFIVIALSTAAAVGGFVYM